MLTKYLYNNIAEHGQRIARPAFNRVGLLLTVRILQRAVRFPLASFGLACSFSQARLDVRIWPSAEGLVLIIEVIHSLIVRRVTIFSATCSLLLTSNVCCVCIVCVNPASSLQCSNKDCCCLRRKGFYRVDLSLSPPRERGLIGS